MQYMGGKARIAKRIVQAIVEDGAPLDRWFEPFMGGGNVMEFAAPVFGRCIGADAHVDLIMMWQATIGGWAPPEFVSKEEYAELKKAPSSALRGFVGFGASFGGKWFGGYGVSPRDGEVCRASYRSVTRQARVFSTHGVGVRHANFGELKPSAGTVVYCDPPYFGTTKYTTSDFDYQHFYSTLSEWAREGLWVYVSEYALPSEVNAKVVWSRAKRNVLDKATNTTVATENLFRIIQ